MSEDASPRAGPFRRTLIAFGRAVGLVALIAGIYSILAVIFPRLQDLPRSAVALVIGVTIFEILRPARKRTQVATDIAATPVAVTDSTAELAEAQALIARLRDDSMEREAALRRDTEELIAINDGLRRDVAALNEVLARERAAAEEVRGELEKAHAREERLRDEAAAESEHLQRAAGKALDEGRQMRERAEELRRQLETERKQAAEALQKAEAANLAAARDLERVAAELEGERKRSADAAAEAGSANRARHEQLGEAAQEIENARAELQRERQRAADAVEGAERASRARNEQLAEAMQEIEKARKELQRERQRATDAVGEAESANRARHEQLGEAALEIEKARGESMRERQRADQAVRELQNALSSAATAATQRQKLESQLTDFDRRLSGSMQELEALQLERQRLRREIEETRQRAEVEKGELRLAVEAEANARMQEVVNKLTSGHDAALRQALAATETALADAQSLTARLDQERQRSAQVGEQRAALEDHLARLENVHENALGEAIGTREAARAEARAANGRALELERDLAALRDQIAKTPQIDEEALREAIDAEWSAKLQTIVSHMATDHEADVGKAIEEREAARAEARNLAMKIGLLQSKLRTAEEQIAALRNVPPPAAEPAVDEERARAEVLQIAEQANAVIQATTSPGNVPLPQERRARVLFVHHDPALRSMWCDNLEKSGFDVRTAADGLEGLRLTVATKPDVVVADASMPKMGGRELCQLIKSNQETATVKVVLMTGVYTTELPIDAAAREFEADELLRKPVKFEALKAALSNLLAPVQ